MNDRFKYSLFPSINCSMEFPHRVIDVTSERRTRGKFGQTTMKKQNDFTISVANSRCAIQTCQTNRLIYTFVISMDIKLLFVRFDFLLSYHGNQLRSCLDGELSLPGFSPQLLVGWLVD